MMAKTNLLGLSQSQLESFFLELGEKRFRATQLMKWMHHLGVDDFSLMNNLSKKLRETLLQKAEIVEPEIVLDKKSVDGTRKWVIRVASGSCVETVYIPEANRGTLCVSSQVGCALDCSFCSTGKQGFNSNLTSSEIVAQVRLANRALGCLGEPKQQRKVTNVVLMGMGEPLLNFDNVMSAVSVMMDDFGYGISKRRVTVSTAGVVPALLKMNQFTDASIAISLHAPNDELRNELVPINKKYPIAVLLDAVKGYLSGLSDKRKATIEYTLLKGVNDQPEHAAQLVKILKDLPCKINLIPFNPFPNSEYRKPSSISVQAFRRRLTDAGFNAVVRTTRGDDIDAACGQLVGQVDDKTRRNQRYQQLWATSEAQTVTVLPHS